MSSLFQPSINICNQSWIATEEPTVKRWYTIFALLTCLVLLLSCAQAAQPSAATSQPVTTAAPADTAAQTTTQTSTADESSADRAVAAAKQYAGTTLNA